MLKYYSVLVHPSSPSAAKDHLSKPSHLDQFKFSTDTNNDQLVSEDEGMDNKMLPLDSCSVEKKIKLFSDLFSKKESEVKNQIKERMTLISQKHEALEESIARFRRLVTLRDSLISQIPEVTSNLKFLPDARKPQTEISPIPKPCLAAQVLEITNQEESQRFVKIRDSLVQEIRDKQTSISQQEDRHKLNIESLKFEISTAIKNTAFLEDENLQLEQKIKIVEIEIEKRNADLKRNKFIYGEKKVNKKVKNAGTGPSIARARVKKV